MAETAGRPDWRDVLQGRDNKDNRSGATIYGTTKLFNIMFGKELNRRLQVWCAVLFPTFESLSASIPLRVDLHLNFFSCSDSLLCI